MRCKLDLKRKKKKREMFAALRSFNKNPIPTPPPPRISPSPRPVLCGYPTPGRHFTNRQRRSAIPPLLLKVAEQPRVHSRPGPGGWELPVPPWGWGCPLCAITCPGNLLSPDLPFCPRSDSIPHKKGAFFSLLYGQSKCSVDDKVPLVSSALPTVPFPSPSPARQSPHYQRSLTRWMLSFPASPRIHEAAALHRAQLSPRPSHEAPMRGTRDPSSGHHADLLEHTESITQLCSAHHWPRRPAVLSPILPYLAAKHPPSGEKQSSQRDHGL